MRYEVFPPQVNHHLPVDRCKKIGEVYLRGEVRALSHNGWRRFFRPMDMLGNALGLALMVASKLGLKVVRWMRS
jgi:hypothetical protein